MGSKPGGGRRGHGALIALCAAMAPAAADAQGVSADRIDAIERQIRNLQSELQQLKGELGEAKQQLRQSRSEAQRSKEEARQAREAAEQARQNAARAATAESQATQAVAQAQAAAVPPPAPGSGIKVDFPGGRPTISTSDGSISFAIGTQIQFDMGGYFQNPTATTQFPHLNDGVNLRRGRIFFNAKFRDFIGIITPISAARPTARRPCTRPTSTGSGLNT
jgi:phosphate-selective porin OprO and OprP